METRAISAHIVRKLDFCYFLVILKIKHFFITLPLPSPSGGNLLQIGIKILTVG